MSNKESNTSWLQNCPTVCYLIGFFAGAILFHMLCGKMSFGLAALIAILAFLAIGWILRALLCSKKATEAAPLAAAAPVAAATKAPAKKPAAKKAPAKTATAKKAPAKKPAAKKPAAKKPATKAAAEKPPVLFTKRPSQVDDLKLISGVGPKLEKTCNDIGVYQFAQIANWKKADIAVVDDKLSFKGRIERDEWVKQAKALVKKAK